VKIQSESDAARNPFDAWLEIVDLRARVKFLERLAGFEGHRAHEMNAELPAADRAVMQAKGMI